MNKNIFRFFTSFYAFLLLFILVNSSYSIPLDDLDEFIYLPIAVKAEPETTYPGWIKSYGNIIISDVIETNDNHLIAVGRTYSGTHPGWSAKLDHQGQPIWMKVQQMGGSIKRVHELSNQDLVFLGSSNYYEGISIARHQPNGDRIWGKFIDIDGASTPLQDSYLTHDEGLILVGGESYHSFVWRVSKDGDFLWQKEFNNIANYVFTSVQQTSDNGFIIGGYTADTYTDNWAGWVLKLDASGNVLWQKLYDAPDSQYIHEIRETKDGNYLAVGKLSLFSSGKGWVMKLNKDGELFWSSTYFRGGYDSFTSLQEMPNGKFFITGNEVYDPDIPSFFLQIDNDGELGWQRKFVFDTTWFDTTNLHALNDGGLIVSGSGGVLARVDDEGRAPDCSVLKREYGLLETYPITVTNTTQSITPTTLIGDPSNWYVIEEMTPITLICPQNAPSVCNRTPPP